MTRSSVQRRWLGDAADHLLDVAGELFEAHGVAAVGMSEIAASAGCSRATLYRYFPSRHDLRVAFVHREARRLASRVAEAVSEVRDPEERVHAAVLAAVHEVRSTPTLAAWFREDGAGTAVALGGGSDVVEALTVAFLGAGDDPDTRPDTRLVARWLVRVVVSLLTLPGSDAAEEDALVRRFVVPAVVG